LFQHQLLQKTVLTLFYFSTIFFLTYISSLLEILKSNKIEKK